MTMPRAIRSTPAITWSVLGIIKKYWYWIILFFFLLPTIISAISTAIETNNPSYPFFILATHITSSDQMLELKADQLEAGELDKIVRMEKPDSGIWKKFVWYWKWFWNVPFNLLGLIYTIFLPAVIIYKLLRPRNTSEPYKNFFKTCWIFILYLFITNTVILIYGVTQGTVLVKMPEGVDKFKAFFLILIEMIPFHGIAKLIIYFIHTIIGTAPPIVFIFLFVQISMNLDLIVILLKKI